VQITARRGGLVHEYWKHKITADLWAKSLPVEVEGRLETGRTADILIQLDEGPRAIEIETGKSDAQSNIDKCQKAAIPVTVVGTDRDAHKKLIGLLKTEVKVLCSLDPDLLDGSLFSPGNH
jgi:hypothetical protein